MSRSSGEHLSIFWPVYLLVDGKPVVRRYKGSRFNGNRRTKRKNRWLERQRIIVTLSSDEKCRL